MNDESNVVSSETVNKTLSSDETNQVTESQLDATNLDYTDLIQEVVDCSKNTELLVQNQLNVMIVATVFLGLLCGVLCANIFANFFKHLGG